MSSLRQDPLTGRWVIVAAKRRGRPNDFKHPSQDSPIPSNGSRSMVQHSDCPFCPGQEHQTPPELLATGRSAGQLANSVGWRVRVFPNKFPAMGATESHLSETDDPVLRPQGPATGGHEVLVCGPDHQQSLAHLSLDHLVEILSAVRQRTLALGRDNASARYVLAFGNYGPEAGATLAHPHLQLITTPVVPAVVVEKMANFIRHRQEADSCLMCDLLESEEKASVRMVASNQDWVAIAPWASRFAFEMRLIPRRHSASLLQATDSEIHHLAGLLKVCLGQLLHCHPEADFNLVFHNAPLASANGSGYGNEQLDAMLATNKGQTDIFHWHLEITPRLSRLAGFETGSGFAINSMPPEEAAARLRPEGR